MILSNASEYGVEREGVALMGLLLPHIFTVTLSGDMITVSRYKGKNHTGGGKRDAITGFSKESRYRMFRMFHSLEFSKFTFITLTYGGSFPDDPAISKRHLQRYRRFTEKGFGPMRVVWRAELQKRGAIHYHLLYLDAPFIPVWYLEYMWHEAREQYGLEKTRNSVHIEKQRRNADPRLVASYVGKYIGKPTEGDGDELPPSVGRVWGKWNIEEPKSEEICLNYQQKLKLEKMLFPEQEERGWRPLSMDSYTCFGSTMGTRQYSEMVKGFISGITARKTGQKPKKVTNSTVPVGT